MKIFENRKLLIVTKHGKEEVLKPLLEESLKVNCVLNVDFDTDSFGTFSGEIDRKEDALTTIRKKCLATMLYHNVDLAVASEGSFGPHPSAFFTTADDELVILIDVKNNLEIIGRKISFDTNFALQEFMDSNLFQLFLQGIKFPSHKIILKNISQNNFEIYKDIYTEDEALRIFRLLLGKYGSVSAETDMRAMNNPTRMKVIKEAAEQLVEKIKSSCPKCEFPGFSVTSAGAGLRCSCCNRPTKSTLYNVISCSKCKYKKKDYFPRDIEVEDPTYCDYCNP
jgi:hypothetical protein